MLEPRTLLSTTVTLPGTAGTDAFLAVLDATGNNVQFYVNATPATGSPFQTVAKGDAITLILTGGGGTDTLTIAAATNLPVTLDATAVASLAVTVAAGTLAVAAPSTLSAVTIGPAGTVEFTAAAATVNAPVSVAGTLRVDNPGQAATTTLAGPVTATGADARIAVSAGTLSIPASIDVASGGTLTLPSPGTLSMPNWAVGNATVQQNGGMVSVTGGLAVGTNGGTASYDLAGGTLSVPYLTVGGYSTGTLAMGPGAILSAAQTEVGNAGFGTLADNGGTASLGGTSVGYNGGVGHLDLAAGGQASATYLNVGSYYGTGTATVSGAGTGLYVPNGLGLGDATGATGTVLQTPEKGVTTHIR